MNEELEERLAKRVLSKSDSAARLEWLDTQKKAASALYDYRFDHVVLVVRIAKELSRSTGADMEIVTMAAWLHDYAKPGMAGVKKHGIASAEAARGILLEEGIDQSIVERVCDTIEKHVGLTLDNPVEPLEAKVLWDADKIVKLGVVGLLHFLVNGLKINPGLNLDGMAEKIREFLPLGQKIVASMNTPQGKAMAKDRFSTLVKISEALDRELGGRVE